MPHRVLCFRVLSTNFLSLPLVSVVDQTDGVTQAGFLDLTESNVDGNPYFPLQNTTQSSTSDALKSSETCACGGVLRPPYQDAVPGGDSLNKWLQLTSKAFHLDC